MNYTIQVFCEQPQEVSLYELSEFILEGAYFENVKTDVLDNENSTKRNSPKVLKINYEDNKPPIIIYNVSEPEGVVEETKELLFVLELSSKTPKQKK
jgi:hypothetical protein